MIKELLSALEIEKLLIKMLKLVLNPICISKTCKFRSYNRPQMVEAVIDYLQGTGFNNICILEGLVGDRTASAFKVCDMKIFPKSIMFHYMTYKKIHTSHMMQVG